MALHFIRFGLAMLLLAMICQSCKQECECPIERPTTSIEGSSVDSTSQTYSIDSGLELNIPNVKKLIETKFNLSGSLHKNEIQVEKTYWEILDGNPEITQHANLFWTTACAMYEIACEDHTISDEHRELEKRQIIKEYEMKISNIIEDTLPRPDTQIPDSTSQFTLDEVVSKESSPKVLPPPKETGTGFNNYKEISGSVYGSDGMALSGVKVWCASCAEKLTVTTDEDGYFSFKGTLKGRSTSQLVQICFRYLGITDCSWVHYNYLDQISITPKF